MSRIDRYTCEQVFRLLDDYLDRELTAEEMLRVKEHLDTCSVCADEHQFQAEVIGAVRERIQRIAISSSLRDKLTHALRLAQADKAGK
jgi:anti-sigma factor (TIGR02949 family)